MKSKATLSRLMVAVRARMAKGVEPKREINGISRYINSDSLPPLVGKNSTWPPRCIKRSESRPLMAGSKKIPSGWSPIR